MGLFKQILVPADLPPELIGYEAIDLDFKAQPTADAFEMAKDAAAFANANGGVVLIGAAEDRAAGRLGRYKLLEEAQAAAAKQAFEEAVANRCIPRPLIDPKKLPHGNGFVVAVNVWPFPSQAVAVKIDGGNQWGGESFIFPVRVGTQTRFISPEQLPMLMMPEVRRAAILLDAIPKNTRIRVARAGGSELTAFAFVQVDVLANVVTLADMDQASAPQFNVPLDVVKSVWQGKDLYWRLIIDAQLAKDAEGWQIRPA